MSLIGMFFIGFISAFLFMFIIYWYQMGKMKSKATKDVAKVMDEFKQTNKINDEEENKDEIKK